MSVLQIAIAVLPFLLSLASRTGKAIAPCLLASIFTDEELMSSPNNGGAFGLKRSKSIYFSLCVPALSGDT